MDYIDEFALESWTQDITKLYFNTLEELGQFRDKCQTVMDKAIYNHDHDRVTYILNFYELWKSQPQLPVADVYRQYREPFPDENRPDCIGRALKLKKMLSEELSQEYPDIREALYVASNTFDYENHTLEVPKEMQDNHHYFLYFSEHVVLSLKFEVNGRIGFIIYDMSFANITVVVVMLDNQPPTQSIVKLANGRSAAYKCLSENYLEVYYDQGGGQSINVFRITIYVGARFRRVDTSAKFCVQQNQDYKYAVRSGIMLTRVNFFQDDPCCRIFLWDESKQTYFKIGIPVDYFIQDSKDDKYEEIIAKVSQFMDEDFEVTRKWMVKLSLMQKDTEFLEQLRVLPMKLKKARIMFLKSL